MIFQKLFFIYITVYLSRCVILLFTANDQCMDEPCDLHAIEQTEKGFRCAIDIPSVLYKFVALIVDLFKPTSELHCISRK